MMSPRVALRHHAQLAPFSLPPRGDKMQRSHTAWCCGSNKLETGEQQGRASGAWQFWTDIELGGCDRQLLVGGRSFVPGRYSVVNASISHDIWTGLTQVCPIHSCWQSLKGCGCSSSILSISRTARVISSLDGSSRMQKCAALCRQPPIPKRRAKSIQ